MVHRLLCKRVPASIATQAAKSRARSNGRGVLNEVVQLHPKMCKFISERSVKMMQSVIHEAGSVQFPLFRHERHYMIPFKQSEGLPKPLSHWQPTVDDMLEGIKTDDTTIYFMADQSLVFRGETQRRPGVHVDGYWIPELRAHGGGSHGGSGGGHGGYGRHSWRGGHGGSHMRGDWSRIDFSVPEALILATSVEAACGYEGDYDESLIREGGDASLVPLHGLKKVHLEGHRVYVGNVGTLHESLPVSQDCLRTLVRLNVPGVTVQ